VREAANYRALASSELHLEVGVQAGAPVLRDSVRGKSRFDVIAASISKESGEPQTALVDREDVWRGAINCGAAILAAWVGRASWKAGSRRYSAPPGATINPTPSGASAWDCLEPAAYRAYTAPNRRTPRRVGLRRGFSSQTPCGSENAGR